MGNTARLHLSSEELSDLVKEEQSRLELLDGGIDSTLHEREVWQDATLRRLTALYQLSCFPIEVEHYGDGLVLINGTYVYALCSGKWRNNGKGRWYYSRNVDQFITKFVLDSTVKSSSAIHKEVISVEEPKEDTMKTYYIDAVVVEHNKYQYAVKANSMAEAIEEYQLASSAVTTLDVAWGVGGVGEELSLTISEKKAK